MAINFPSTAGQATDGSYTYTVAGITYAWNGSSWAAAGAGASATNRTLFSVTQNAAGSAALSYSSATGVFSYTPPDLSGYLTAEADTLASVVARGNTTGGNINLGDNEKAIFGPSNAFEIYHNGGTSYIDSNSGRIFFQSNSSMFFRNDVSSSDYAKFLSGGAVELYHSGSKKFETTSAGATITGALTAGGLTYPTTNGTSGDVLTSDGAGNVSWATPTGLQTRTTAQVTVSATQNVDVNTQITTPNGYALLAIGTSHAAWVTLYMDTNSRTLDAGRGETSDPVPGSGVLAEVITTGSATQYITPGAFCFNTASNNTTYIKAVGKAAGTVNLTITLTYIQLEG